MTRTGKIARLPRQMREQLNRRLRDGEVGTRLVEWLNSLPEVNKVLAEEFGGRPISEQNLSEWKHGGYAEWEQHEESRALVRELTQRANDLTDDANGLELSHRLATVLSVELARVTDALLAQTTDPQERWRRLREFLRELVQLRQEDRKAGWLSLERERRDMEVEKRLEEERSREVQVAKSRILAPLWAKAQLGPMAELFGGGDDGRAAAAFVLEVQRDLSIGTLMGKAGLQPRESTQTESNQIKPDQDGCGGAGGDEMR